MVGRRKKGGNRQGLLYILSRFLTSSSIVSCCLFVCSFVPCFIQTIPLYTTAAAYPWYRTVQPLALSLTGPSKTFFVDPDPQAPSNNLFFEYRYAIHRAGVFHRFEAPSDASNTSTTTTSVEDQEGDVAMDIGMDDSTTPINITSQQDQVAYHQVPLRLLANRESYVVNDVLGKTTGPPDIDHNRFEPQGGFGSKANGGDDGTASVATMHSRSGSFGKTSSFAAVGVGSSGVALNVNTVGSAATAARKKAVGFAPAPPRYHRAKDPTAVQAVHLNSTDGLVVVSVFLPVVLHRSDQGQWSADWDYEVLLSMQTHLRVTRIGVVKWRGWHGNTGSRGSPEAGVPVNERHLVEDCLRPFNCVPVWIDTTLFGEM